MKKILQDYWLEIMVLLVAFLGVVLLAGNAGTAGAVKTRMLNSFADLQQSITGSLNRLDGYVASFTAFDLVGWLLVALMLYFVVVRMRRRFRNNPENAATVCPRCASQIRRVHRSTWDRILANTILPNARRYACTNKRCGWSGLRHQRYRLEPKLQEGETSRS